MKVGNALGRKQDYLLGSQGGLGFQDRLKRHNPRAGNAGQGWRQEDLEGLLDSQSK